MSQWLPIEYAPKDGRYLMLWDGKHVSRGSWREDAFMDDEGPLWLRDDYDDFSTGYASTPLRPTHWFDLPEPPK